MTNTPAHLKEAAAAAVEHLLRDLPGAVKAVVIATEDGFEVAGRSTGAQSLSRLSALASSLASLGALAAEEGRMGACDNVSIETTQGYLLMVRARHRTLDLIVCILASHDAVLGRALYLAKQAARSLRDA